jgi:NADH-quinone oxidoreductase subunit B
MWRLASRPGARVQVLGAGLACCSLEVEAAVATGELVREDASHGQVPNATVLVVAGTITKTLEPAVEALYSDLSSHGPVQVMAFGACATSGDPYWDAPTVVAGVRSFQVESYVPGCPPRPQALVAELERIVDAMVVA